MLVRDVALADRYSIHGHLADSVIVYKSSHQYQNMENLMRLELNIHTNTPEHWLDYDFRQGKMSKTYPNITLSGEPSFRHSQGVEQRSQNV